MNLVALPVELLLYVIAELSSRQDFISLQLTCTFMRNLFRNHQQHQYKTHLREVSIGRSSQVPYTDAKPWLIQSARSITSPHSMIQAYLVAYLPSELEASRTLYSILWARRYTAEFEAFVLETLYGYVDHQHFLQDRNGAQKLRQLYVKDNRLSSLSPLLGEEDRFCRAQKSYSSVSERAFEVCREYEQLEQREHALHLAQHLLDGLTAEFGPCAPSTVRWANRVGGLRAPGNEM